MARLSKVLLASAAAVTAVCHLRKPAFVPSPVRRAASVALPAAAAAASAPAFAAEIGDAAKKLSDASYPFLKEFDWNSYLWLFRPGSASAGDWAKAISKTIKMGADMDPALLKKGVEAPSAPSASPTQ